MSYASEKSNTIDDSIITIGEILSRQRRWASYILTFLISITMVFTMIIGYPLLTETYLPFIPSNQPTTVNKDNLYIGRLNYMDTISHDEFKFLITRSIEMQRLLNERNNYYTSLKNNINPENSETNKFNDYLIYGIFILIFGVTASFYRHYLKEISKLEHYLVGFHRIRVAGNNSITKYDDEVKISLTRNAFEFDNSKKEKVINPIPGHPSSDIAATLLNKILDKLEFKEKKEKNG